MIESTSEPRRVGAGQMQAALVVPGGPPEHARGVGPFMVLVHALPFEAAPGELPIDHDVRPHPHIGLAAVTYLLTGSITHRDSLGSRCELQPGDVGFTLAGRGVVHSERFDRVRPLGGRVELLQILLALPDGAEESEPAFVHVEAARIPELVVGGARVRVVIGTGGAVGAPGVFPSPAFLHDVHLDAGGRYELPEGHAARAVYVVAGAAEHEGTKLERSHSARFAPGPARIVATEPTRLVAFGGAEVGPRYMWWNFIHSSRERIEAARADWRAGRFPLPPGDTESFTPAPADEGRPLVHFDP